MRNVAFATSIFNNENVFMVLVNNNPDPDQEQQELKTMNNTNSALLDHDASLTLCGRDIVQPISIFYSLKISVSG